MISTIRIRAPLLALLLSSVVGISAASARSAVVFEWEDDFAAAEREKLEAWTTETVDALESLTGPMPCDVVVFFHRKDGASEPVPWAHTERSARQGVHFHVDPGFALADFRADWTAAHEFSHLVLPYVGRRHAWFSEGFASFLQYQVMAEMGVLDGAEARSRYASRLDRAAGRYRYHETPFVESTSRLRAEGAYPVMYWGGSVFFMRVDERLTGETGEDLNAALGRYLECCRRDESRLDDLLETLDRVTGTRIFTEEHARFRNDPGFPKYDEAVLPDVPVRPGAGPSENL